MKYRSLGVVAAALCLMAGASSAATCTINSVTFGLTPDGAHTDLTCETGNDASNSMGSLEINDDMVFGSSDWTLAYKRDASGVDGDGSVTASFDTLGANAGTWSVTDYTVLGVDVALVLKSGNQYGAFLLSGNPLSGDWESTGAVLSHLSLWTRPSVAAVPLPAGAALMLTGIGGLALARRRRK